MFPRAKDHLTKIPTPDEKPSFELLVKVIQKTPKILQGIAACLGLGSLSESLSLKKKLFSQQPPITYSFSSVGGAV